MIRPQANALNLLLGLGAQPENISSAKSVSGPETNSKFAGIFDLLTMSVPDKAKGDLTNNTVVSNPGTQVNTNDKPAGQLKDLMASLDQLLAATSADTEGAETPKTSFSDQIPAEVLNTLKAGIESGAINVDDLEIVEGPVQKATPHFVDAGTFERSQKSATVANASTAVPTETTLDITSLLERIQNNPADDVAASLPVRGAVSNARLTEILGQASQPTDLNPGTYQILNTEVKSGNVSLELQSRETGEKINVTVPAAMLADKVNSGKADQPIVTPPANRVPLTGMEKEATPKLDQMFAKLNLLELEVSEAETTGRANANVKTAASAGKDQVNFKIFAEQSGQEVLIKGSLPKTQVKAEISSKLTTATTAQPETTPNLKANTGNTGTENHTVASKATTQAPVTQKEFSLLESLSGNQDSPDMTASRTLQGGTVETEFKSIGLPAEKSGLPAPKLNLPENVGSNLQPNGKSVMIKIDPEHLGSARLYLTVRNETLTARLMVDTVQAKSTLEGSLDQLTEQLNRAGIKVQQVEVGVAGGDVSEHLFNRQSAWRKPARFNRHTISNPLEGVESSPVETKTYRTPTYIRNDEVNVFA